MELQATGQDTRGAQDEREWELADEDLDRAGDNLARTTNFTSFPFTHRPCSSSRCHCR